MAHEREEDEHVTQEGLSVLPRLHIISMWTYVSALVIVYLYILLLDSGEVWLQQRA